MLRAEVRGSTQTCYLRRTWRHRQRLSDRLDGPVRVRLSFVTAWNVVSQLLLLLQSAGMCLMTDPAVERTVQWQWWWWTVSTGGSSSNISSITRRRVAVHQSTLYNKIVYINFASVDNNQTAFEEVVPMIKTFCLALISDFTRTLVIGNTYGILLPRNLQSVANELVLVSCLLKKITRNKSITGTNFTNWMHSVHSNCVRTLKRNYYNFISQWYHVLQRSKNIFGFVQRRREKSNSKLLLVPRPMPADRLTITLLHRFFSEILVTAKKERPTTDRQTDRQTD